MSRYDICVSHTDAPDDWEPWELNLLEGEPHARVHYLRRQGSHGNLLQAGLFIAETPCVTASEIREDETLHVLSGRARLEFDDGQTVELATGSIASLPKGARCTWRVLEAPFRHFWVYAG